MIFTLGLAYMHPDCQGAVPAAGRRALAPVALSHNVTNQYYCYFFEICLPTNFYFCHPIPTTEA